MNIQTITKPKNRERLTNEETVNKKNTKNLISLHINVHEISDKPIHERYCIQIDDNTEHKYIKKIGMLQSKKGETILHDSVRNQDYNKLDVLIEVLNQAKCLKEVCMLQDENGQTALHYALGWATDFNIVRLLVQAFAKNQCMHAMFMTQDVWKKNALETAALHGHLSELKLLLLKYNAFDLINEIRKIDPNVVVLSRLYNVGVLSRL